jgi:2-oxoglutarate ferredoxin oxidoreductase subunit gamma
MAEIRFAGYGGQGIIRSGYIVGRAASLYDKKFATLTQDFGPESRGGACSAQVVVSGTRVLYPYVTTPDVFVAMSQEGYDKFEAELSDRGLLIIDEDLVRPKALRGQIKLFAVPATRFAEELGNRIIANVVILGFFTAVTSIVAYEAMKSAIPDSVPEKAVPLNMKAFERGYEYGQQVTSKT